MALKIYVASSWRNEYHKHVVNALLKEKHTVYDFTNPPESTGFGWSQIDENWKHWNNEQYLNALEHPISRRGFKSDMNALKFCDVCILVMPCGRSAHLELGYAVGAGKHTAILLSEKSAEPELMYLMADVVTDNLYYVLESVQDWDIDEDS